MLSINPYVIRNIVKATLLIVTLAFFFTHSWCVTYIRMAYIQRYLQYQLNAGADPDSNEIVSAPLPGSSHNSWENHIHSNESIHDQFSKGDEEADVFNVNDASFSAGNASGIPPHVISSDDDSDDDHGHGHVLPPLESIEKRLRDQVMLHSSAIVLLYLLIEVIFLAIYLLIIMRRRLCYLVGLTVFSCTVLINYYINVFYHRDDEASWLKATHFGGNAINWATNETITFAQHVASLTEVSTFNHMTQPTLVELVLATIETMLFILFTTIVVFYPEPYSFSLSRNYQRNARDANAQAANRLGIVPNGFMHFSQDGESVEMLPLDRNRRASNSSTDSQPPVDGNNRQEVAAVQEQQALPKPQETEADHRVTLDLDCIQLSSPPSTSLQTDGHVVKVC